MVYEKVIKDERGKIRIEVRLNIDSWHNDNFSYQHRVWHIAPKKRIEFNNQSIATEEEIKDASLEFWNLIKPKS